MVALRQDFTQGTYGQHIIFGTVLFNKESAYNEKHGLFTAPTTGTYSFSTTLTAPAGQRFRVALVKNDISNVIGYIYADITTIYLERSITVLTHMNRNDEVWMICLDSCFIEGNDNRGGRDRVVSTFSGFLISAD